MTAETPTPTEAGSGEREVAATSADDLRIRLADRIYDLLADEGGPCLNSRCENPLCLLIGRVYAALEPPA